MIIRQHGDSWTVCERFKKVMMYYITNKKWGNLYRVQLYSVRISVNFIVYKNTCKIPKIRNKDSNLNTFVRYQNKVKISAVSKFSCPEEAVSMDSEISSESRKKFSIVVIPIVKGGVLKTSIFDI